MLTPEKRREIIEKVMEDLWNKHPHVVGSVKANVENVLAELLEDNSGRNSVGEVIKTIKHRVSVSFRGMVLFKDQ